jgi:hypothetical protein
VCGVRGNVGQRIVTAIGLVAFVLTVSACHAGHPGTDADRVACTQLGTALTLTKESTPPAVLLADYRTAQNAAGNADDVKLLALITSARASSPSRRSSATCRSGRREKRSRGTVFE